MSETKSPLDRFMEEKNRQHALDLPTVTAAELAERVFLALMWAVVGLIPEGAVLLVGAGKIGKSFFMLMLCSAVANGTPFLGRQTVQGTVLYLALEDSERRLKDRMQDLGLTPSPNLYFCTEARKVSDGLLLYLERFVDVHPDTRLIVVDTMQRARGISRANVNAYESDYEFLGAFVEFAKKHHVAVVLVHHTNKSKGDGDPFNRISGSTGLMGAADTTILMDRERGTDNARLTVVSRDFESDPIMLKREGVRWCLSSAEEVALARYEQEPIVQAVRALAQQPAIGGLHRMRYEDFRQWGAERGLYLGKSSAETHKLLNQYADELLERDGFRVHNNVRVDSSRGFMLEGKT